MPTTTIRLDEALKARIASAAERANKTSHAFIVEAIEQTVEQAEAEDELHRIADERWARLLATGETVPWDGAAKDYLEARARGEKPKKPPARPLGPRRAG
jgi:predicted transcriptional regulator